MKKLIIIVLISLVAIVCIFGLRIASVVAESNAKLETQTPHLRIVSPDPIIADSTFKVSAFAQLNDESNEAVPILRIIRESDNTYISGKAMKFAYVTDYTMIAPTSTGAYKLEFEGMKQAFFVHPISAELHILSEVIYPTKPFQIKLETNSHGARQRITIENSTGGILQIINNGLDQDFSRGTLEVIAPEEAGSYRLIYKNSRGEDITSVSFEVSPS